MIWWSATLPTFLQTGPPNRPDRTGLHAGGRLRRGVPAAALGRGLLPGPQAGASGRPLLCLAPGGSGAQASPPGFPPPGGGPLFGAAGGLPGRETGPGHSPAFDSGKRRRAHGGTEPDLLPDLEQFPETMRKKEARAGSAGQGGGRRRADACQGRQHAPAGFHRRHRPPGEELT